MVGDVVFLKVFLSKGVLRFDKSRMLALRYTGLFKVLDRVGVSAY